MSNVASVMSREQLKDVFSAPSRWKFGMGDRNFSKFFSLSKEYVLLQGRGKGNLRINEAVAEILEQLNRKENSFCRGEYLLQIVYPSNLPLLLNELESLQLIDKRLQAMPLWSLAEIEEMEIDLLINLSFAK